jgi:hypothetical protein
MSPLHRARWRSSDVEVAEVNGGAPCQSVGKGDVDGEAPCQSVNEGDIDVAEVDGCPLPKC